MTPRVAVVPLVAFVLWELVAKVTRIPTPSTLIRRSARCQPAVRHFLTPLPNLPASEADMNTCQTCRHWQSSENDAGICDLITPGGASGTHLARATHWGSDAGELFMTRGSFGCTEHELPDDAA